MAGLNWINSRQRLQEWTYAKTHLTGCSNGTKLRRKDHPHMQHSFIVIDGKIMAMSGEKLGRGSYAHTKLCEEEDGKLWALKITDLGNRKQIDLDLEEHIVRDLGIGLKATKREPYLYFFGSKKPKHYLAMHYLGKHLTDVLCQDLSELQRYELAISLLNSLHSLHSGEQSKDGKRYAHGDIALRNCTIDDKGVVHLIDFGLSYLPTPEYFDIKYADSFYIDAMRISHSIRDFFPDKDEYLEIRDQIDSELGSLINQMRDILQAEAEKDGKSIIDATKASVYVERMITYFRDKIAILSEETATEHSSVASASTR